MSWPNLISLSRLPLAYLFVVATVPWRHFILALALATDGLDGYLARRWQLSSRLGATLDPLTDKIFVLTALATLYTPALEPWHIAAFFSRDIALLFLSLWLLISGRLSASSVRSIWPGKAATCLQFTTLALMTSGLQIPSLFWWLFIILGAAFFLEFALQHLPQKQ